MALLHCRTTARGIRAFLLTGLAALLVVPAAAQEPPPSSSKEDVTLTTKDGVTLKASYYPSTEGKEAVPVILLHDLKGSRHELHQYAEFLQRAMPPQNDAPAFTSLAVMVPDLRGHGDSTQQQIAGRTLELDASRLRRADFANMILRDMEAIRRFLLAENDKGKLNLNKLAIVGAGMGATVALNWTARDWAMPPLATGKQGQDVKALALISPEWSLNGVSIADAMKFPPVRGQVSMFVAFGERESDFQRDAERIFKLAESGRAPYDPSQGKEKQEVFLFPWATPQQGGELLLSHPPVGIAVREFIENRVVKQDFPWLERKAE